MHVADVGRAFIELLLSDVTGAVNVASGDCRPIREVVTMIGALTGAPHLARLGALPPRPGDAPRLAASIRRLRDEVGFRPTYDLATGLADTVAWWQHHSRTNHP